MKANYKALHRCLALLLCIVMVAALLPEMTVSAALDTPIVSAQKSGSSIKVSWKPVTGAVRYRVFRKGPSDSTWKELATVSYTTTSYTDSNVKSGATYTYTVRCVDNKNNYVSSYDHTGASVSFWACATPSAKVAVVDNGIKVSWSAVSGAELYRVFRKQSGSWVGVGYTTGTSLVDVSVTPGKTYTYTVRCYNSDKTAYTSDYNHTGWSIAYTRNFAITSLEAIDGGVSITWTKHIDTTVTYKIERSTGQDWRDVGSTTGTSFKDMGADFHTGVANQTTYKYRVYYTVGGSTEKTAAKSITYYQTPELDTVVVKDGVFTVKWLAVQGVSRYRVYRKLASDTKWSKLADVTGTSYADKSVASGLNYYYTVRCLSADGSAVISGYNSTGIIADYIGTPTLISTSVENDGIHFRWNAVGGVKKYQVYRKTPSTSWEKYDSLQTVTGEVGTYVDTNAASGQTYYYTVACDDGAKKSDYDPKGLACTKLANPKLKSTAVTKEGIKVNWYGVDKAVKYRVYRKEASGTVWKKIGETTELTYVDTTVVNKGRYVYTVRCITAKGTLVSGYDETGLTRSFYSTPVLVSAQVQTAATSGSGAIIVTWKPVEGVSKYSIYRRYVKSDGSLSSWTPLTNAATGSTYKDSPSASGYKYIYTVRCSNGSGPISYFDGNGVGAYFLKNPELVTPFVKKGAIQVKWKYVDGAKGYAIYRKVSGHAWTKIATVNSATTLTYADYASKSQLVPGEKYIYTVRAINGSYMSGWNANGITATAQ